MNPVDYGIIGVLVFFLYRGYNKGAMASILGTASYFISAGVAMAYKQEIGDFLNREFHMSQKVTVYLQGLAPTPSSTLAGKMTKKVVSQTIHQANDLIISSIGFLAVFICLTLIIKYILPSVFKKMSPRAIGFVDKLFGGVINVALGYVFVLVLLIVLEPTQAVLKVAGYSSPWLAMLKSSVLCKLIMGYLHF